MQDYRRLRVWEKAHDHALHVRTATQTFPKTGYADLKSQITSAAESIAFNIVEGCGAITQKDFAKFLSISIKSSFELEYQLKLSRDYGVLPQGAWKALTDMTEEIRKMLCGLRKKVLDTPEN